MFMNTMAVGPLELVASCVTGGTVARFLCEAAESFEAVLCHSDAVGAAVYLVI